MSDDLGILYQQVVEHYRKNKDIEGIERSLHKLAEAQEANTKILLQEMLSSNDWWVRSEAVILLGFHYVEIEAEVIQQLETMLLEDPSEWVRLAIPSVLPYFVEWPNLTLLSAMQHEDDIDVRNVVISAILRLNQFSYKDLVKIEEIIKQSERLLTFDDLKQLLEEHQLPTAFLHNLANPRLNEPEALN